MVEFPGGGEFGGEFGAGFEGLAGLDGGWAVVVAFDPDCVGGVGGDALEGDVLVAV